MRNANNGRARGNRILESLTPQEQAQVARSMSSVELAPGQVIGRAGKKTKHVFFPREGVISLFASAEGGPEVGVGTIGAGGMVGLAVAAGRPLASLSAVSQGNGTADRMEAAGFIGMLGRNPGLRHAMLAYGHQLSVQMAQNTVCTALHTARQRLARWMLDVTAGSTTGRFSSTQAATATALGVQRPAVSRAASMLRRLGLITYQRGEIEILDRAGLAAIACNCTASAAVRPAAM